MAPSPSAQSKPSSDRPRGQAPLEAAAAWDNVGVLLDAPTDADYPVPTRVFLTNDLTTKATLPGESGGSGAPNWKGSIGSSPLLKKSNLIF